MEDEKPARLSRQRLRECAYNACDGVAELAQFLEIVAKDLDGNVRTNTRDEHAYMKFDGLRESEGSYRNRPIQKFFHRLDELAL